MTTGYFVIDEWLLHDLRGDNGEQAKIESLKFLEILKERCDRIAVLRGSQWMKKAYELMKDYHPFIRFSSKYLHLAILRDPKKCHLLDKNDIAPISDDLRNQIPTEDLYLIQIYCSIKASALVTTDEKLYSAISNAAGMHINVKIRSDFLKDYLIGK